MPEKYEQYIEQENKVLSKFESNLSGTKLKLEKHYKIHSRNFQVFEIDGLISTPQGYPYALIEVKLKADPTDSRILGFIQRKLSLTRANYAILTDNTSFYFLDSSKSLSFKKMNFNDIIRELLNPNHHAHSKLICEYLNEHFSFLHCLEKDVCFDGNKYTLTKRKEKQLINNLIHFKDYTEPVYRYTTLNTAFEMLKNKNIRMLGIAGMNDVSEVNYVENFLYQSDALPLNPEINKIFITSCSKEKNDDLTQWRLYADDAKGVRLKFNVNGKKTNFVIREIIYRDLEEFEEIGQLKKLIDYVRKTTAYTFVFNTLHEWSHFIKPNDYQVEDEVRLLYILPKTKEPKGWLLANNINIINPYVEFSLDNNFPLIIDNLKLGPKCPEQKINKYQLNELMKKINPKLDGMVEESKIKNYR